MRDLSHLSRGRIQRLDITRSTIASLAGLADAGIERLDCSETAVADLTPALGPTLQHLDASKTALDSLPSLSAAPALSYLNISSTAVADLSPANGSGLRELAVSDCPLGSLEGIDLPRLHILRCSGLQLTTFGDIDLSALSLLDADRSRFTVEQLLRLGDETAISLSRRSDYPWRPEELDRLISAWTPIAGRASTVQALRQARAVLDRDGAALSASARRCGERLLLARPAIVCRWSEAHATVAEMNGWRLPTESDLQTIAGLGIISGTGWFGQASDRPRICHTFAKRASIREASPDEDYGAMLLVRDQP